MAVAVAAAEVHPAVDARRIPLQHLLDEAHALEELAPVEGRNQAQAGDQVGHARLCRRLVLSFRANDVLERLPARLEERLELVIEVRGQRAEVPRVLQQAGDKRMMDVGRPSIDPRRGLDGGGHPIGRQAVPARGGEHVRACTQMIDERELQCAWPSPQLAHRQRGHGLEGADEPLHARRVEAAGTQANQFEGERVDAGQSREFVGGHLGQPPEECRRQVVVDITRGCRDDVEIVEEPLGRRRHGLLLRVFSQRDVDLAQGAHVALELAQVGAATAARARRKRQQRGEAASMLLEQLDAEQFFAAAEAAWSGKRRARHRSIIVCPNS